jgi:hypothetical protein|tara:strand:- start:2646 stop:4256 length:1611 start_codon:yes stop_codon:yes gene_type:complete
MDNIIDKIDKIDKIYEKSSFSDKYGGSIFMTILIFLIFFICISYFLVISNSQPIKDDWINKRCSPAVIPFAGFIMDPDNPIQFTSDNFQGCVTNILKGVAAYSLVPINAFINIIMAVWTESFEALNSIRILMNKIRNSISNATYEIYERLIAFLIPLQKIIISARDMLSKTQGIMTAVLFTGLGVYDTMLTGIGATWDLIMIIFISITTAIVLFLSMFFTIPVGLIALAIYIPLAVIMIEFLIIIGDIMNTSGMRTLPKTPSCFAANTKIKTKTGYVNIQDLKPGTILYDNSVVTATMQLSSYNQIMYNLHDIIVSDTHKVLYNQDFIPVPNHPDAIKIDEFLEQYIYCFNTSNKVININNITFSDWDDLDDMDIYEIKMKCRKYFNCDNFKLSDIHKYLESGFHEDTLIELEDGNSLKIKDIQVNDVLKFGERVIGKVCIDTSDIDTFKYDINNNIICGAANLQIYKSDLGIFDFTLDKDIYHDKHLNFKKYDNMYHLLTDKNIININGIYFYDYNGAIDSFLEDSNFKFINTNF